MFALFEQTSKTEGFYNEYESNKNFYFYQIIYVLKLVLVLRWIKFICHFGVYDIC